MDDTGSVVQLHIDLTFGTMLKGMITIFSSFQILQDTLHLLPTPGNHK